MNGISWDLSSQGQYRNGKGCGMSGCGKRRHKNTKKSNEYAGKKIKQKRMRK